jgi:hypothetical protein
VRLSLIGRYCRFGRLVLRLGLRLLWYDVINPDLTTHFLSQIGYNTASNPDTKQVISRCPEYFLLNLGLLLHRCTRAFLYHFDHTINTFTNHTKHLQDYTGIG